VNALVIVEPETVIRWHRAGFRLLWRWKSRCRGGRPKVPLEIRFLIRDMSLANPLWARPAWLRRNVLQPCEGGLLCLPYTWRSRFGPLSMPSLRSSPWIRRPCSIRLGILSTTHPHQSNRTPFGIGRRHARRTLLRR
jgi:hypothetical protein